MPRRKRQREIIERKIVRSEKFPSGLDDRLNAILSSINREPKQILLLALNRNPQTASQVKDKLSTNGLWDPSPKLLAQYCRHNFVPAGLVVEEELLYPFGQSSPGYLTNDAGDIYGRPLSLFTLIKLDELGRSLFGRDISAYEVFGINTSHGKNSASYNRGKILLYLNEAGKTRITDLENILDSPTTHVPEYLAQLKNLELVDFESFGGGDTGFAVYSWNKGKPEDVKFKDNNPTLTRDVARLIYQLGSSECNEITEKLYEKEEYKAKWNKDSLRIGVSRALSDLKEKEFLTARFQGKKVQSEVWILEKGRYFVAEYLKRVQDALQIGAELKYMWGLLGDSNLRSDAFQELALRRILAYKQVCPLENAMSSEYRKQQILDIINAHPDGIRPRGIKTEMGINPAYGYFKDLLNEGQIKVTRHGRSTVYKPA